MMESDEVLAIVLKCIATGSTSIEEIVSQIKKERNCGDATEALLYEEVKKACDLARNYKFISKKKLTIQDPYSHNQDNSQGDYQGMAYSNGDPVPNFEDTECRPISNTLESLEIAPQIYEPSSPPEYDEFPASSDIFARVDLLRDPIIENAWGPSTGIGSGLSRVMDISPFGNMQTSSMRGKIVSGIKHPIDESGDSAKLNSQFGYKKNGSDLTSEGEIFGEKAKQLTNDSDQIPGMNAFWKKYGQSSLMLTPDQEAKKGNDCRESTSQLLEKVAEKLKSFEK